MFKAAQQRRRNIEPEQAENPQKRVGNTALTSTHFRDMKLRTFSTALAALALCTAIFSCAKTDDVAIEPVVTEKAAPSIPSGERIIIHFGTSTYLGCMYSFSNCIWIGWGAEALNYDARLALQFDKGDEAGQYFGQYFPLTADYKLDAASAKSLGLEEQVIPAGFYALRDAASGQATGQRLVQFNPSTGRPVKSLVNPNNPQDNIGQLHNLAVQVVLHDNRDALKALGSDRKAVQKFLTEKVLQFLAEAELPLTAAEQQYVQALNLDRNFADYKTRLDETRLSANDKKVLLAIFDEAAGIPVRSPEELSKFVSLMTERENQLAREARLDNPRTVLSMVSVLKYSRYFWFWKQFSSPNPGGGSTAAAGIPEWVWADIIGLELGGPVGSAVASALVYWDTH